jgi:glycosyltransferase involved in cell wall biosynthesis
MRTELGLQETVQFIGFIDDPAGFLANLDLFMLSSVTEGFSIATIQAMAAGLPVLVTQSGGPQEIVAHGVNGWMVPPGDSDSLAAAVARLAADPALRTSLAEAGKEHVSATFDIGVILNAYCDIYDTLF